MTQETKRRFSRAFKLAVVARLVAGEGGSALARELSIKRELLYRWRDHFRAGGELALRPGPGRPKQAEAQALAAARGPAWSASDLEQARRQIAALERKVGQQQLDLDFFKHALRHLEASRQASDAPGVTASSPISKR